MKQEKEMLEIKSKTTVQWLLQTGALCLLQPVQGAVIRLNAKQSSHVLTANVKVQWGAQHYKAITTTTNYPAFKDALFITEESKLT